MRRTKALYMFAFMPPELTSFRIDYVRHRFADEYTFVRALKPPVHITLLDPFFIPLDMATAFENRMDMIEDWAGGQSSFPVELRDFNFFENPSSPVADIDVVKNMQLHELRNGFLRQIAKHFGFLVPKRHKPHVTIGYRDVGPNAFPWIKADYSGRCFNDNFTCESFCLWKHDGSNWQVVREFALNGMCEQLHLFAV